MHKISKLIYKISDHIESSNTQELLLEIKGINEGSTAKTDELKATISEEIQELQSLLDDKENIDYIAENLLMSTIAFEMLYKSADINIDKLIQNSIGKEELYKYLTNLKGQK